MRPGSPWAIRKERNKHEFLVLQQVEEIILEVLHTSNWDLASLELGRVLEILKQRSAVVAMVDLEGWKIVAHLEEPAREGMIFDVINLDRLHMAYAARTARTKGLSSSVEAFSSSSRKWAGQGAAGRFLVAAGPLAAPASLPTLALVAAAGGAKSNRRLCHWYQLPGHFARNCPN